METSRVYDKLLDAWLKRPRYISSCGGTRSGKTYSILQLLIQLSMMDSTPKITSVVSETLPHLKRGAIRDFKQIMGRAFDEDCWNQTELTYKFKSGSIIEFFSADNPAKVHGPARDRLFINECQNISYEVARQLFVRTRGMIIIDYNPTHSFWANEIIELRDNCQRVHSTYLDNDYLTPEQVAEIESNRTDQNWWTVYGEGKVGSLEGVIYQFEVVDHMPPKDQNKPESQKTDEEKYADSLKEVWGMDFGFTNDPTAIVRILADQKRKEFWIEQKCYRTNMMNEDIANHLEKVGLDRRTEIYADCAEPKSIAEIGRGSRFNIKSCDKGAPVKSEKMRFQIQWVQGWKLHVTKESLDLIDELRHYVWEKDKTGKQLNEPIDSYNHLLDAMRYALWSKFGRNAGKGIYNITIK